METEGDFRVIDPATGKPRKRGTEDWSEATYQEWKRLPYWQKYNYWVRLGPFPWVAIGLALGAAFVQWVAHR
jgi:hypothetical protein